MEAMIKEIQQGNKALYKEVVIIYQNKIFHYILKMMGNLHIAEELTQEVFITAYTNIHQYHEKTTFQAWLYKIAHNKTLNYLKRSKRERSLYEQMKHEEGVYDEISQLSGFNQRIEDALNQLKPEEKNLLILKAVEELSYEELATIYGIRKDAIRKKYERAKKKFKLIYENQGGGYLCQNLV